MDPRGIVAIILALTIAVFLVGSIISHATGAKPFAPDGLAAAKDLLLAVAGGLLSWLSFGGDSKDK